MTEVRNCPECKNSIVIRDHVAVQANETDIGCLNRDKHEDGETVVMWPEEKE